MHFKYAYGYTFCIFCLHGKIFHEPIYLHIWLFHAPIHCYRFEQWSLFKAFSPDFSRQIAAVSDISALLSRAFVRWWHPPPLRGMISQHIFIDIQEGFPQNCKKLQCAVGIGDWSAYFAYTTYSIILHIFCIFACAPIITVDWIVNPVLWHGWQEIYLSQRTYE